MNPLRATPAADTAPGYVLSKLAWWKSYFPYRIAWVAVREGQEPQEGATATRRTPNRLAREGWTVYVRA